MGGRFGLELLIIMSTNIVMANYIPSRVKFILKWDYPIGQDIGQSRDIQRLEKKKTVFTRMLNRKGEPIKIG